MLKFYSKISFIGSEADSLNKKVLALPRQVIKSMGISRNAKILSHIKNSSFYWPFSAMPELFVIGVSFPGAKKNWLFKKHTKASFIRTWAVHFLIYWYRSTALKKYLNGSRSPIKYLEVTFFMEQKCKRMDK